MQSDYLHKTRGTTDLIQSPSLCVRSTLCVFQVALPTSSRPTANQHVKLLSADIMFGMFRWILYLNPTSGAGAGGEVQLYKEIMSQRQKHFQFSAMAAVPENVWTTRKSE